MLAGQLRTGERRDFTVGPCGTIPGVSVIDGGVLSASGFIGIHVYVHGSVARQ